MCTYVGAVSHNEQQIMEAMAEKFLSADTDFFEIKKNAEFFPFTNAMEFNRFLDLKFCILNFSFQEIWTSWLQYY